MPTFPQPPHSSQISHHRAISVDTSPEPLQVGQVLVFTAIIIAPGGPSISPTPLQFGQFANFLLLKFCYHLTNSISITVPILGHAGNQPDIGKMLVAIYSLPISTFTSLSALPLNPDSAGRVQSI